MKHIPEARLKEIQFYAEQFHHNSSALKECDPERTIQELLAEVAVLKSEYKQLSREAKKLIKSGIDLILLNMAEPNEG